MCGTSAPKSSPNHSQKKAKICGADNFSGLHVLREALNRSANWRRKERTGLCGLGTGRLHLLPALHNRLRLCRRLRPAMVERRRRNRAAIGGKHQPEAGGRPALVASIKNVETRGVKVPNRAAARL